MSNLTACVCDLDGTLLDTEPFYEAAWQAVAKEHGKTYDWETQKKVIGRPEVEGAQAICDSLSLPFTAEEALEERDKILLALFETAKPLPGAIRLARYLKVELGWKIAIATSSNQTYLALKRKNNAELFSFFDVVICGDDPRVKKGKPAPDIFLVAAEELGVSPQHCLAFEDTSAGIESASSAGMTVIGVPHPKLVDQCQKAAQILPSLEAFDPTTLSLPPMQPQ